MPENLFRRFSKRLGVDTVVVKVLGESKLTKKFKALQADMKKEFGEVVEYSAKSVVADAKRRVRKDEKKLEASIDWAPYHEGISAIIFADEPHAPYIEKGTRPRQSTGAKMPPPSALAGWAERHGMPGAEWAIAINIWKRGTPAHPFLQPAVDYEKPLFEEEIKKRTVKFEERIAKL